MGGIELWSQAISKSLRNVRRISQYYTIYPHCVKQRTPNGDALSVRMLHNYKITCSILMKIGMSVSRSSL